MAAKAAPRPTGTNPRALLTTTYSRDSDHHWAEVVGSCEAVKTKPSGAKSGRS